MSNSAPTNNSLPLVLITPGEPAGIGPEISLHIARDAWPAKLLVLCDPRLLHERGAAVRYQTQIETVTNFADVVDHRPGIMQVMPLELAVPCRATKLDARNAHYVLEGLEMATNACADGTAAALVTGPVHKGVINQAGIEFTGHTEFLAEQLGVRHPVMMLVADALRVVLVTTHLPLRDVSAALSIELVAQVIRVAHTALVREFGFAEPRLAICGLNPHAGEDGYLGDEEQRIISPAIERCADLAARIVGPLAADTAFTPHMRTHFDAIVTMYHDQGLPALKSMSFGDAVNVTLGLPIIRTSVDHGTALDLAGSGTADPRSLRAALELAITLASTTQRSSYAPV